MAQSKKEPEIAALEAIYAALKPLDPEARQRVLASARTLLEMPSLSTSEEKPSTGSRSGTESIQRTTPTKVPGLTELKNEKSPHTNPELITLFAYYRERYESLSNFGREDIQRYFSKAHEPPPGNYGRDFAEAVKRGWIHEDGDNSYITSKGIEVVESGFGRSKKSKKS